MNRFQEALNDIKDYSFDTERLKDDFDILQELIDNYEKLEQKNIELKLKRDKTQILFEEATSKLMKALDKICGDYANVCNQLRQNTTKEELKEYYLKESEKQ